MVYGMEQGPYESKIIEDCIRNKMPIPEKIANAPQLYPGLDLFYIAFMDLKSCRQLGHGALGSITWLTVDKYCERYGITGEQYEDMHFFIRRMDEEYLKSVTKKYTPKPSKE